MTACGVDAAGVRWVVEEADGYPAVVEVERAGEGGSRLVPALIGKRRLRAPVAAAALEAAQRSRAAHAHAPGADVTRAEVAEMDAERSVDSAAENLATAKRWVWSSHPERRRCPLPVVRFPFFV